MHSNAAVRGAALKASPADPPAPCAMPPKHSRAPLRRARAVARHTRMDQSWHEPVMRGRAAPLVTLDTRQSARLLLPLFAPLNGSYHGFDQAAIGMSKKGTEPCLERDSEQAMAPIDDYHDRSTVHCNCSRNIQTVNDIWADIERGGERG